MSSLEVIDERDPTIPYTFRADTPTMNDIENSSVSTLMYPLCPRIRQPLYLWCLVFTENSSNKIHSISCLAIHFWMYAPSSTLRIDVSVNEGFAFFSSLSNVYPNSLFRHLEIVELEIGCKWGNSIISFILILLMVQALYLCSFKIFSRHILCSSFSFLRFNALAFKLLCFRCIISSLNLFKDFVQLWFW